MTSVSATNSARYSLDFPHIRQKMTPPTANETTTKRSSTAIMYAAKKPTERPIPASCRTLAEVSRQAPLVHTVWSCTKVSGILTTTKMTVRTAAAIHSVRARTRKIPRRWISAGDDWFLVTDPLKLCFKRCIGKNRRFITYIPQVRHLTHSRWYRWDHCSPLLYHKAASSRLVQKDELRVVQERSGDGQALFHAQ